MKHLLVWGGQHCSSSSDFQMLFTRLISNCTILPKPLFHEVERLEGPSITDLWHNLDLQPTLLVIIVGDNHIREGGTVTELLQHFRHLYKALSCFPLLEVVTCGLIPEDDPTTFESKQIISANRRVKELQLSFSGSFVEVEGIFKQEDYLLFDYLNERGSKKLARLLVDHILKKFPNSAKLRLVQNEKHLGLGESPLL